MRVLLFFLSILLTSYAYSHEVRPAYLGIVQLNDSIYKISWKIPAINDKTPKISPAFPADWNLEQTQANLIINAAKKEWTLNSKNSIKGNRIRIEGLEKTLIDVLINVEFENGEQYTTILQADNSFYTIPIVGSKTEVVKTYTLLGIDHILFGIDHLLFVLALIFITQGKWKIITTISAFTLSHSITLTLSALELVKVSIAPVEAIIALSIIFLAKEILDIKNGKPSLTFKYPWLVAFLFGLLHGFGFASALSETGLPQTNLPYALGFFNVGVELGQLIFLAVVGSIGLIIKKIMTHTQFIKLQSSVSYGIGGVASFWFIERLFAIIGA